MARSEIVDVRVSLKLRRFFKPLLYCVGFLSAVGIISTKSAARFLVRAGCRIDVVCQPAPAPDRSLLALF